MTRPWTRREFATMAAGAAAMSAIGTRAADGDVSKVLIIGVACSPRRGKTTARAVEHALEAARNLSPTIETDLIDLGGLRVSGYAKSMPEDDFTPFLERFKDSRLGGLIIGSPCYYRAPSALCRAFIERLSPLREPVMVLADKPVGAVGVGAFRNGGQELVISEILTSMLCFGMMPVGGNPPAFQGATVVSKEDDISADTLGLETLAKLGQRVAAVALRRVRGAWPGT